MIARLVANPWLILAGLVLIGATFVFGMKVGKDWQVGKQARLEQTLAQVERRTQQAVAAQIAAIEIKHVTIEAKTHEILRQEIRYRECINDDAVRLLLDEARAGSASAVDSRQLP